MNLANKITLARIALIPLFMICFLNMQSVMIALIIFAVAAGTDKLDGYVARKYNQITNLGKLLDPLADKLLIAVALVMMVQENMISSWIAVIIIGREIVITALLWVATGVTLLSGMNYIIVNYKLLR